MRVCYSAGDRSYGFTVSANDSLPGLIRRIEGELFRRHPTLRGDTELPERVREEVLNSLAGEEEQIELGLLSAVPVDQPSPQPGRRRRPAGDEVVVEPAERSRTPGNGSARDTPDTGPGILSLLLGLLTADRRAMLWNLSRRAWRFFVKDCGDLADDARAVGKWTRPRIKPAIVRIYNGALTLVQIWAVCVIAEQVPRRVCTSACVELRSAAQPPSWLRSGP